MLVTDLDPDEQKVVLATTDSIGRMAEWDETSLDELLRHVEGLADQDLSSLASITRIQMADHTLWDPESGEDNEVQPQNVPMTKRIVITCPADKGDQVLDTVAQALDGIEGVTIG